MARSGSSRRGRPRSFDVDAAVDAALAVFWRVGFEAASIQALAEATGLGASSLYAAFGSKRGLFDRALARYEALGEAAFASLRGGSRGLDDIDAFLDLIAGQIAGDGPRGCLVVHSTGEVAPTDPELAARMMRQRGEVREAIAAALRRAVDRGELDGVCVDDLARALHGGLFGVMVVARSGARDDALATLDALRRDLRRRA